MFPGSFEWCCWFLRHTTIFSVYCRNSVFSVKILFSTSVRDKRTIAKIGPFDGFWPSENFTFFFKRITFSKMWNFLPKRFLEHLYVAFFYLGFRQKIMISFRNFWCVLCVVFGIRPSSNNLVTFILEIESFCPPKWQSGPSLQVHIPRFSICRRSPLGNYFCLRK